MKIYEVNVHYDMVCPVVVEAENEQQALSLAERKAACIENPHLECYGIKCCVTDEHDIPESK